jgi:hypothetical protein
VVPEAKVAAEAEEDRAATERPAAIAAAMAAAVEMARMAHRENQDPSP